MTTSPLPAPRIFPKRKAVGSLPLNIRLNVMITSEKPKLQCAVRMDDHHFHESLTPATPASSWESKKCSAKDGKWPSTWIEVNTIICNCVKAARLLLRLCQHARFSSREWWSSSLPGPWVRPAGICYHHIRSLPVPSQLCFFASLLMLYCNAMKYKHQKNYWLCVAWRLSQKDSRKILDHESDGSIWICILFSTSR